MTELVEVLLSMAEVLELIGGILEGDDGILSGGHLVLESLLEVIGSVLVVQLDVHELSLHLIIRLGGIQVRMVAELLDHPVGWIGLPFMMGRPRLRYLSHQDVLVTPDHFVLCGRIHVRPQLLHGDDFIWPVAVDVLGTKLGNVLHDVIFEVATVDHAVADHLAEVP